VTRAAEEIQSYRIRLRALERSAWIHASEGRYEGALRSIAGGADWAWFNHTGVFASPLFESLLPTIGARINRASVPPRSDGPRRVLHVLTQAYPTGGHTRLAWRWMALDQDSQHDVLLTNQHHLEIPAELSAACQGRLRSLPPQSMVENVRAIGSHVMHYDLVVLHIHPFDAATIAALAGHEQRPRTLLVNHADHVFWLGLSAADHIVNLRPASEWIGIDRRTGSDDAFVRLPLPLEHPEERPEVRSEVRRALGIDASSPVLTTVAQPYKYASPTGPGFTSLVRELFQRHGGAHLIAVGPSSDDSGWSELEQQFPNRVHLLGVRTEYTSLLEAADIYLDSFPFSSITSVLEAAYLGLPVLTRSDSATGPLNFDDFELVPETALAQEDWLSVAEAWCDNRTLTRAVGSGMRRAVASVHGKEAWLEQLAALYAAPWQRQTTPKVGGSTRLTEYDDAIYDLHHNGGLSRPFEDIMRIGGIRLSTEADNAPVAV
jgi:hypothetical protein